MTTDLRLAAFDLDGTLLDSAGAIVTGVLDCWEACGFPLPEPDDIGRIDWRGLAKTGELSTVNFRETRATKTVVVADGRVLT